MVALDDSEPASISDGAGLALRLTLDPLTHALTMERIILSVTRPLRLRAVELGSADFSTVLKMRSASSHIPSLLAATSAASWCAVLLLIFVLRFALLVVLPAFSIDAR